MANSFQGIANGLAMLKNYYEGPIKDQFSEEIPIFRAAEKIKKGWSGLQVVRPLRVRRNQGIGATSDNGPLPNIGRQGTVQAIIPAKFNYLRFGVTGPMIKASQSDIGSFVRSASYELEMGYKDLKSDVNRQVSWDGTGTLAQANATTTASTSLVIKGRESTDPALRFVDQDLVFDIVSSSSVIQSGIQVLSITSGSPTGLTATLSLSQPVTCAAGDTLVRSNSYGQEIQGLLYSQDNGTTTIYNVNRSTYQIFQSNYIDVSGGQLTIDYMQQAYNAGMQRGGAKYNAIWSDFNSLRYYQKLLSADKRYVNTVKGDGGFAEKDKFYLDFNGIPIVPDKDAPLRIMMVDEDIWKNYVLAEMEFADETGSMFIAQSGADALEVRVRFFANLFNEQPAASSLVTGYVSP